MAASSASASLVRRRALCGAAALLISALGATDACAFVRFPDPVPIDGLPGEIVWVQRPGFGEFSEAANAWGGRQGAAEVASGASRRGSRKSMWRAASIRSDRAWLAAKCAFASP